jgi:hypothetical protein
VNIYAEEMTERVEIVEKEINGQIFTGVRFYLYLPVTINSGRPGETQITGPFLHSVVKQGEGVVIDDDSSAVTFWGKSDLRDVLWKTIDILSHHYKKREEEGNESKNHS